ncbi:hypothetical protein [Nocardia sp. NPDC058633]|uniref:hypothetical protein n=1 Tax=Nocardia sp. NPDC058633 TaxID=3346568 RepID=UPI00365FF2F5
MQAKIAEAATQVEKIRGPLDWERQVELWGDRKLLHDMMMHGHQHLQGRTEAQGWRHEHPQPTTLGPRRHDAAQVVRVAGVEIVGTTTEFKAGWVSKKEGLRQLYKERELLAKGLTQDRSEYIIRESRPPHPEVMREAQQLAKDFPGKFVVIEMSEPEFIRAVEAGRPIARAKTVEKLGHLIEKVRDSPELRTVPRALEQFTREIEMAKERGNPIGLEALVQARDDLAYLVEADKVFTQRVDKAAREASQLRLKESQIVEQVQAQQRDQRAQVLWQQVARVDREIVLSAVTAVRAQLPAKAPVKQLDAPGLDPEMARAMGGMLHLMHQRDSKDRAVLEREVLAGLVLPTPMHREVAEVVLAQQRDAPGQGLTVEHVKGAEQTVREREARELEQARQVQAREARERENREMMARVADAYNKQLAKAAREQAQPRGWDRLDDAKRRARMQGLAQVLQMDAKGLADKGIDAQVVDAIARGMARSDDQANAMVVEVSDGVRWVDKASQEVALAKQIQMVERGTSLETVQVRLLVDKGRSSAGVAVSREELERQREELERERVRQRERHPEGKSRARQGPERGKERGIERGR